MIWRLVKVTMSLMGVHLEVAQAEVKRDATRLVTGVALIIASVIFFGCMMLAVNAAAVVGLAKQTNLAWWGAILVVGGIDLFLGVVLVFAGRSKLRGPVLTETRTLVKRTVNVLREVESA
jgi:hypothetical protein